MKLSTTIIIFIIIHLKALGQIIETNFSVFTKNNNFSMITLDSIKTNYNKLDTVMFSANPINAMQAIIPEFLNQTFYFSNFWGTMHDSTTNCKPCPSLEIKLKFILNTGINNNCEIIYKPVETKDSIILIIDHIDFIEKGINGTLQSTVKINEFPLKKYFNYFIKNGFSIYSIEESVILMDKKYGKVMYRYNHKLCTEIEYEGI